MSQRPVVLIESATVTVWKWSHNSVVGLGVYDYTITDDATGIIYKGKTKSNAGFRQAISSSPRKLTNVRLVGKVMTGADEIRI